jgi:hypothetical protein
MSSSTAFRRCPVIFVDQIRIGRSASKTHFGLAEDHRPVSSISIAPTFHYSITPARTPALLSSIQVCSRRPNNTGTLIQHPVSKFASSIQHPDLRIGLKSKV